VTKNYSPGLRQEVVSAAFGHQPSYARAGRDFGITAETVRRWMKCREANRLGNTGEAQVAAGRAGIRELERRVRELEEENRFLKKAAAFFAKE
jgi:transposase